jgi:GTP-binding protein
VTGGAAPPPAGVYAPHIVSGSHIWRISAADYETSAPDLARCPEPGPPEVAFAGRSNVGKSSLLNAVTGVRGLARVGATPGRTQLLNFFGVTLKRGEVTLPMRIVDLPGYGYAATGRHISAKFGPMIEGYLAGRKVLRALAVLIDARRGVDERDLDLMEYATGQEVPCLIVVTKADKLSASKRGTLARKVADAVGARAGDVLLTSSSSGLGIADEGKRGGLLRDLAELVGPES